MPSELAMVDIEIRLCTVAIAFEKLIISVGSVVQCYPQGAMWSVGRSEMFECLLWSCFPPSFGDD